MHLILFLMNSHTHSQMNMQTADSILTSSSHIKIDMYFSYGNITCMQVDEMKSNLSQIGYDVESIHQMISGLVSCDAASYFLSLVLIEGCLCWLLISLKSQQEGKLELLESKQVSFSLLTQWVPSNNLQWLRNFWIHAMQDTTNSGLWHLCQFAGGFKDGLGTKVYQVW